MESNGELIYHPTAINGERRIRCGLTSKVDLIKRAALPTVASALLLSIAAISTPAQAQTGSRYECKFCEKALSTSPTLAEAKELDVFKPFGGFRGGVSVGAARGQTVRVVFRSTSDAPAADPDVIVGAGISGGHVRVFNAATGALLWSREVTNLTTGIQTFDINRDELPLVVNSDSGRVQLWIEVVLIASGVKQTAGVKVSAPTFEIFENATGRTNANGGLWKTTNFLTTDPRGGTIVFTGLE